MTQKTPASISEQLLCTLYSQHKYMDTSKCYYRSVSPGTMSRCRQRKKSQVQIKAEDGAKSPKWSPSLGSRDFSEDVLSSQQDQLMRRERGSKQKQCVRQQPRGKSTVLGCSASRVWELFHLDSSALLWWLLFLRCIQAFLLPVRVKSRHESNTGAGPARRRL